MVKSIVSGAKKEASYPPMKPRISALYTRRAAVTPALSRKLFSFASYVIESRASPESTPRGIEFFDRPPSRPPFSSLSQAENYRPPSQGEGGEERGVDVAVSCRKAIDGLFFGAPIRNRRLSRLSHADRHPLALDARRPVSGSSPITRLEPGNDVIRGTRVSRAHPPTNTGILVVKEQRGLAKEREQRTGVCARARCSTLAATRSTRARGGFSLTLRGTGLVSKIRTSIRRTFVEPETGSTTHKRVGGRTRARDTHKNFSCANLRRFANARKRDVGKR